MKNIAILVGISSYDLQPDLPCCKTDVDAIEALIRSTERFDVVAPIKDVTADELKSELRRCTEINSEPVGEIFFYFSGHGDTVEDDFYFCTKDFDARRPNQTGLSNSELRTLLRAVNPQLVANVIDACNSGVRLIKRGTPFIPIEKAGLNNLIQIASCLDSQTSLAGEPLSEFTEAFCEAAISKADGPIYYTDIISALRDRYLEDDNHTPLFTLQAPGREVFIDDVAKLSSFKADFEKKWTSSPATTEEALPTIVISEEAPTLLDMLKRAEASSVTPERLKSMVDTIFDGLADRMAQLEWKDLFDVEAFESREFSEQTSYALMTKILSKENRRDKFVTAEIKRSKRKRNRFDIYSNLMLSGLYDDDDWVENFDLSLNISMDRAQVRHVLRPKFIALQKFSVVVSCAPSLEQCYVFVVMTQHPRTDWDNFSEEGPEIIRRWFKAPWDKNPMWIVEDVSERIENGVRNYVESLSSDLSGST